jgi:hypothetical protein
MRGEIYLAGRAARRHTTLAGGPRPGHCDPTSSTSPIHGPSAWIGMTLTPSGRV